MASQLSKLLFITCIFFACKKTGQGNNTPSTSPNEFQGRGGIYYLGSADIPISNTAYTNPNLAGVVVRFKWETLETAPGVFNWNYIDNEITKARTNHKKVSLQPLGYPAWVVSSLGAASYSYIDRNSFHTTYLDTLQDVITWNDIYLNRVNNLINKLADKYAADTTITYVNAIASHISRGLPDSVVTATGNKAFYTLYNYNADTLIAKMKTLLDLYMLRFANTPIWNSIDYVSFETKASGRPINYLASQYAAYGMGNYPNRFGCWREDLSACNPQPSISTTNQWFILQNNPTRTGAQMLWSVQDGPSRMNKCGILPNTKAVVLDSSINNGLRLGMRYFEVYGADVDDVSLSSNMSNYHSLLKVKYLY